MVTEVGKKTKEGRGESDASSDDLARFGQGTNLER